MISQTIESSAREFLGKGNSTTLSASVVKENKFGHFIGIDTTNSMA